ncbi:MAG: beta-hydroxyacyl-ACP dehydratase [Dysgonamonadaceae bacterium]|jgi:3-hydroxyacyl-[acyl-carrier-protein] dehydratase|nr:beta-hydroxyacyl-ACP dehydratase [Dysgonamonadaceae bacterium]
MIQQKEIRTILKQRFSFILIDRVLKIEENEIVGIKNVTASDINLWGHFDDEPIYPGALLIETCSQLGGILIAKKNPILKDGFLAQIDNFKFLKFIIPGDTIKINAVYAGKFSKFAKVDATAFVDDDIVAKGSITYFFK